MKGLFAALITPVDDQGRPDDDGFARAIDFVVERGVDGVCLGGATAEYPHFTIEQRKTIVETGARHLKTRLPFVVAIGGPTIRDVLDLGRHALEHGAERLLLPMPYFFRYEQQDLAACAREMAQALDAPCLLYNLPGFTNPLDPTTTLDLLRTEPNIVGLKDSSGDRSAMVRLAAERHTSDTLFCGSDGLLLDALEAGWDGGISGIASCAPEVLAAVYRNYRAGRKEESRRGMKLLNELIDFVGRLPFPWGIRVACEVRGLHTGPFPWPLSPKREADVAQLQYEYAQWFEKYLAEIDTTTEESEKSS